MDLSRARLFNVYRSEITRTVPRSAAYNVRVTNAKSQETPDQVENIRDCSK